MRHVFLLALGAGFLSSCGDESSDGSSSAAVQGSAEIRPIDVPQPTLVKALDISVYSGNITASNVQGWQSQGFSHVVVGTQNASIAKQQLTTLVAGGMTVDVYVFLYFSSSMTTQVQNALSIASGFPVGRIWLDIEADPGSLDVQTIHAKIQEAVNACGTMPVGIYTHQFWLQHMEGSAAFSDLPLWYAHYDNVPTFDDWKTLAFGGWTMPTAKQYKGTTTVGGNTVDVDKDILWLNLPGSGPPPPAGVPAAPTGLAPNGGTVTTSSTMLTWSNESATKYQILMESGSPGAWKYYWTWKSSTPSFTVWPQKHGKYYRWRVRALNAIGWGSWSAWAQFYFP